VEAFLPGRNLLLLLCGAAYAYSVQADSIAIGLLSPKDRLFLSRLWISFVKLKTSRQLCKENFGNCTLIEFTKIWSSINGKGTWSES
jgi:hypothetical protein